MRLTITWDGDTPEVAGEREAGECVCVECGRAVRLSCEADGVTWDPETREVEDVFWGPAMGFCCEMLYAEDMDGGAVRAYGPPDA